LKFNAQNLRGIVVTVQVGAMKIHVGSNGGGAQEKRKDGETQKTIRIVS
jgi:hypothetical protein